jgi:GNAT superfamily N-acetyltransferase
LTPLTAEASRHVLDWLGPDAGPGRLPLRHALLHDRPGLWGDDSRRPESVLLFRPGDGQSEAFGAGRPGPAVNFLARQAGRIALLAPSAWEGDVIAAVGPVVGYGLVVTLLDPDRVPRRPPAPIPVRRLVAEDAAAFAAASPPWALRSWDSYQEMYASGAAFGVPLGDALASVAWVYEEDEASDAVGIHTLPKYRRLGLGRAAASALLSHIVADRGKSPLWITSADDAGSLSLAASLGFSSRVAETLLRWPVPEDEEKG